MRSVWTVAGAAGIAGLALGFGGGALLGPRGEERLPPREVAAAGGATDRAGEWVARLDAIDAKLATLVVPAAAPSRVAAETVTPRIDERLAAIEASLAKLAAPATAVPTVLREESPRHAKETAAVARLFEAEHGKKPQRTDEHQGYSADRLYDRYGAPDLIERGAGGVQHWVYFESGEERGVYFELQDGVVIRTWAYAR